MESNGIGVSSSPNAANEPGPIGENLSPNAASRVPPGVSQLPYALIPGVPPERVATFSSFSSCRPPELANETAMRAGCCCFSGVVDPASSPGLGVAELLLPLVSHSVLRRFLGGGELRGGGGEGPRG